MTAKSPDPFFVGYFKKVPPEIRNIALGAGTVIVGFLAAMAVLLPLGTIDPGSGGYADDLRGGTLKGVVEPLPYPILRVPATDGETARAVLLGGQRKVGAQRHVEVGTPMVEVKGVFVRRGEMEMLLIGDNGAVSDPTGLPEFVPAASEHLGRWRLTGEICDGKCYSGAMKPGRGLAHKACANLCFLTGLPPILVMALPVKGSTVVLLADENGGPMPEALFDLTGVPLQLEGQLERRDDLLIFRVDHGSERRM